MSIDQWTIFIILLATLCLFVWGRWRYDLVSLAALFSVFAAGLIPADQVFIGFGHPAVITVAAVLILSRGLLNAGVVDSLSRLLSRMGSRPAVQVATLTFAVTFCSGFMNNVGALALLMPVAIWMARKSGRSPSYLLMPLAFGSLMGGLITLIGTPPNIIIAAIRAETGKTPFGMFDFTPVGLGVAVGGLIFLTLMWRLTPRREGPEAPEELFQIEDYVSEVNIPEGAKVAGRSIYELTAMMGKDRDVTVVALVRGDQHIPAPSWYQTIEAGDILLVEATSDDLKYLLDDLGLQLAECKGDCRAILGAKDVQMTEAIVSPGSKMVGKTVVDLDLRHHYGINLLAAARQGQRIKTRLNKIRFVVGDILLLQGTQENLQTALKILDCLPLAERGLSLDKPRKIIPAVAIFVGAMALAAANILPVHVSFMAAVVVMVLAGLVSLDEMYNSIDWPIIVLLGAMFPLGHALESTGGAELIAGKILLLSDYFPPVIILAVLMAGAMLLSNVVNNAAAAVLMAPIAISLAHNMTMSVDPFLMAVAIGASCAFLTPVGHQSNMLVMAPGGYRFGDYWRLGLPLSLLTIFLAVPLIPFFWPFVAGGP